MHATIHAQHLHTCMYTCIESHASHASIHVCHPTRVRGVTRVTQHTCIETLTRATPRTQAWFVVSNTMTNQRTIVSNSTRSRPNHNNYARTQHAQQTQSQQLRTNTTITSTHRSMHERCNFTDSQLKIRV